MFSLCAKSNIPNIKHRNVSLDHNNKHRRLTHISTKHHHLQPQPPPTTISHCESLLLKRNTTTRDLCLCVSSILTTFHFWSILNESHNTDQLTISHTNIPTHAHSLILVTRSQSRHYHRICLDPKKHMRAFTGKVRRVCTVRTEVAHSTNKVCMLVAFSTYDYKDQHLLKSHTPTMCLPLSSSTCYCVKCHISSV